jgi:polyisoprenoid-binding protein YceI
MSDGSVMRGGFFLATPLALILAACGRDAPDTSGAPPPAETRTESAAAPISGRRTFVIVPEQSRASYRANEEFFPGALKLLGIDAGKVQAIGSTQSIEGQFQLDVDNPAVSPGENSFTVRVNTFTSNQSKRDDYTREIRDDGGPSFDAYPVATFKATAIEGDSTATAGGRDLTLAVTGDLTVRDVTKPVRFDVRSQLSGNTLSGVATSRVLLSSFGIGPIEFSDILRVADELGIEVQFTARAN